MNGWSSSRSLAPLWEMLLKFTRGTGSDIMTKIKEFLSDVADILDYIVNDLNIREVFDDVKDAVWEIYKGFDELWKTNIKNFKELTYMCFPRWLAVAETAWNGGSKVGYSNFLNATRFYCDILKEMKVIPAEKAVWSNDPQKSLKELIKHGKRTITPESVVEFLRIQKNELFGGDE
jgi:hypothetical protein